MSSSRPVRNRLRLVASILILAGAIILLIVMERGSLAGGRTTPADLSSGSGFDPGPDTTPGALDPINPSSPATAGITGGPTPVRAFGAPPIPPPTPEGARSPLADSLGDPARSIADDVAALDEIVAVHLQAFRHLPIGTNAEITAALAGDNPRGLAPLPADHRAISPGGELLDRWGTPFFFHQLGREQMEVRSAGPDRRLFTADDVASNATARATPPSLTAR